jgi:cysteinyl-tRNA synthetase
MPLYINNSITRKKEEFLPLNAHLVNMYTCGVTVYDESHIGHARSLYTFDLIRRFLRYCGYRVRFVRNITDIDDKIINRARELNVDWSVLVDKYISSYYKDIETLGIAKGDYEPRATENIKGMIDYIIALISRGFAYESGGDVYFNVRKFPNYGKLSGQSIDQMETGVRIDPSESKKDPLDFALWKKSAENEPSWDSPWGRGRPGWHIECSVMSQKYLKTETLDIHAGGRDLIFPHHENEIAQAEALTGEPFAKYWIHHGLLTINSQKMAKSSGNFVTIKDFLAKYKDPDLLKLFFLSAHYSHPIDYTEEKIEETRQALERIRILWDKLNKSGAFFWPFGRRVKEVEDIRGGFIRAMEDDFNAPQALASLFELVVWANKNIGNKRSVFYARKVLREMLGIFGISLKARNLGNVDDAQIMLKISERERARKNKDFILADKIRAELDSMGVVIEDSKSGTSWRRKL